MKPLFALFLALSLAVAGVAQQPNSIDASMTFDGINGPTYPMVLPLNVQTWNPDLTIDITGPPLRPFILAATPAGVTSPGLPTPFGLVDVDLSGGILVVLDGTAPISPSSLLAFTDAAGQWTMTVPLFPGTAGINAGFQCLMSVPSAPSGFVLTAATHLTTVNVPASAVFVSHSRGAPGNPGTAGSPYLTIAEGVTAATAGGLPYKTVYVEYGSYTPAGGAFNFVNGLDIKGGRDPIAWTPVVGTYSTLNVASSGAIALNILLPTTIEGLELVAGAAPQNQSSIALRAHNVASSLTFVGCRFDAGNGGTGDPGPSTGTSTGGNNGSAPTGATGGTGGVGGSGGCTGGTGGNGGGAAGGNGASGQSGNCIGGTGGGNSAGAFCGGTNNAGNGGSGAAGTNGAGGTTNPVFGAVGFGGSWTPSQNNFGFSGGNGKGGGGGGGSGGNACTVTTGNAGGGGGGGGYGGFGGNRGEPGGASIAVTLSMASPVFQDCEFATGGGGPGGGGGNGGFGGSGGSGAGGSNTGGNVGDGGDGGAGGNGGRGGGGAGGNGGATIGIAKTPSSTPAFVGSILYTLGTPGAGGTGGSAPNVGQAGLTGLSVNVY